MAIRKTPGNVVGKKGASFSVFCSAARPTTAVKEPKAIFRRNCCRGRLKGLKSDGTRDIAGMAVKSAPTLPNSITSTRNAVFERTQGSGLSVALTGAAVMFGAEFGAFAAGADELAVGVGELAEGAGGFAAVVGELAVVVGEPAAAAEDSIEPEADGLAVARNCTSGTLDWAKTRIAAASAITTDPISSRLRR